MRRGIPFPSQLEGLGERRICSPSGSGASVRHNSSRQNPYDLQQNPYDGLMAKVTQAVLSNILTDFPYLDQLN